MISLRKYIYDNYNDLFEDAYDDLVRTELGNPELLNSFEDFLDFMNQSFVKERASYINAEDFSREFFRKNIDEVDPANIIKYYFIFASSLEEENNIDTILLSQIREPNIKGNSFYSREGYIKKLNIKYDNNYDTYNDEFYE